MRLLICLSTALILFCCAISFAAQNYSLRFHGNGINDIDRVKIQIDNPNNTNAGPPADVGASDFTIEFWMRAAAAENTAAAVACGNNTNWRFGNIMLDRDRLNQDRDYGLSIAGGVLVFGVSGAGTGDHTICGTTNVLDDRWHHVAIERRRTDGHMWLFVDGVLQTDEDGPDGNISYPDSATPAEVSDPYLVIGAEKHDLDHTTFPSYSGYFDEMRISASLRYTGLFVPPVRTFVPDKKTAALYHFDEGTGDAITDSSGASGGPSNGVRNFGGAPAGPEWSTETPPLNSPVGIAIETILTGLTAPVAVTNANDNRIFITQQTGQILVYDGVTLSTFLDISSLVSCCGEHGLLSVAFDPNYASNKRFFVYYTNTSGNLVIARYLVSADPNVADDTSATFLLTIPHPNFSNHNGGQLQFGHDGYLYAGTGDGGSAGDPPGNAQNKKVLLGKILRLDVSGSFYTNPPTNPFVGSAGAGEIWDYGFRNPWRFSIDRLTGDLIIGDVGQNTWEEVDYEPFGSTGGTNYGWNVMEGKHCFPPGTSCSTAGLKMPVLEYPHNPECSITGGYRYRGQDFAGLFGLYFYSDFCSGKIWAATQNGQSWTTTVLRDTPYNVVGFGEDQQGRIYFTNHPDTNNGTGALYRIVQATPSIPIFSDDFSTLSGWISTAGIWSLDTGTLLGSASVQADNLSSSSSCSLCNVEADVQIDSGAGTATLLAWYKDKKNNIQISLDTAGKIRIKQRSRGKIIQDKSVPRTINTGVLYHIRAFYDGSQLRVFFDGGTSPDLTIKISSPPNGKVGVRLSPVTGVLTGRFDNIVLY